MKALYIIINLAVIAGPLILSFDKKVSFYKNWKYLFPAIFFMMALFIPWDIFFTEIGVWGFNTDYISGVNLFNLPLGEILFFITIPYACVFIYECLNHYLPNRFLIRKPIYITYTLIIFCLIIYALYSDKFYPAFTSLIALFVLCIQLFGIKKYAYLGLFYRAFIVSMIPMLIIDGILTAKPIVIYNAIERTQFRIGSIPWEDFLYQFIMLYMVIGFYEFLKNRAKKKAVK